LFLTIFTRALVGNLPSCENCKKITIFNILSGLAAVSTAGSMIICAIIRLYVVFVVVTLCKNEVRNMPEPKKRFEELLRDFRKDSPEVLRFVQQTSKELQQQDIPLERAQQLKGIETRAEQIWSKVNTFNQRPVPTPAATKLEQSSFFKQLFKVVGLVMNFVDSAFAQPGMVSKILSKGQTIGGGAQKFLGLARELQNEIKKEEEYLDEVTDMGNKTERTMEEQEIAEQESQYEALDKGTAPTPYPDPKKITLDRNV
jgi:hypothetical protein